MLGALNDEISPFGRDDREGEESTDRGKRSRDLSSSLLRFGTRPEMTKEIKPGYKCTCHSDRREKSLFNAGQPRITNRFQCFPGT